MNVSFCRFKGAEESNVFYVNSRAIGDRAAVSEADPEVIKGGIVCNDNIVSGIVPNTVGIIPSGITACIFCGVDHNVGDLIFESVAFAV